MWPPERNPKKDLHSQCCKPTLWKQLRQLCSTRKSSAAPGSRTGSDKLSCSCSGRVLRSPAKPKAERAHLQSRCALNRCTQLVTMGVNYQQSAAAALNGPGDCAPHSTVSLRRVIAGLAVAVAVRGPRLHCRAPRWCALRPCFASTCKERDHIVMADRVLRPGNEATKDSVLSGAVRS